MRRRRRVVSWRLVLEFEVYAELGPGVAGRQRRHGRGKLNGAQRGTVEELGAARRFESGDGYLALAVDAEIHRGAHRLAVGLEAGRRRPVVGDAVPDQHQVIGELEIARV